MRINDYPESASEATRLAGDFEHRNERARLLAHLLPPLGRNSQLDGRSSRLDGLRQENDRVRRLRGSYPCDKMASRRWPRIILLFRMGK